MGFTLLPGQSEIMYASGHPAQGSGRPNPAGLRVSRDGGESWEDVSLVGEVDFHAFSISPADPNVFYGWFHNKLYRSSDAGLNWETFVPKGLERADGRVFTLAAHPSEVNDVLAGTAAGIGKSTDGGRTWEFLLEGGAVTSLALDPVDERHILGYVALDSGGKLIESADGGSTWTPLDSRNFASDPVGHLAVDPSDPRTIYAGTFQASLYKTTDGGTTWTQVAKEGRPLIPDDQK